MYDLSITGFMSEQELIVISDIASKVPENGVIVELGSYKGRSAVAWASSCHPSVTVYCIDMFATPDLSEPDFFEEFKENTKHLPNIIPIRGVCPIILDYPRDSIDVFFNDATHYNPYDWNNIEYFRKFIKPGGLLMGHDYKNETYPDVAINVTRLEEELNQSVTHYHNTYIYSFRI
jgi:predicted O-methyltransferase YrrM